MKKQTNINSIFLGVALLLVLNCNNHKTDNIFNNFIKNNPLAYNLFMIENKFNSIDYPRPDYQFFVTYTNNLLSEISALHLDQTTNRIRIFYITNKAQNMKIYSLLPYMSTAVFISNVFNTNDCGVEMKSFEITNEDEEIGPDNKYNYSNFIYKFYDHSITPIYSNNALIVKIPELKFFTNNKGRKNYSDYYLQISFSSPGVYIFGFKYLPSFMGGGGPGIDTTSLYEKNDVQQYAEKFMQR